MARRAPSKGSVWWTPFRHGDALRPHDLLSGQQCTRVVSSPGSGKSLLFGASALLAWASRHEPLPWYQGDPDADDFAALWDDLQVTSSDLRAALGGFGVEIPAEDVHPEQQRLFDLKVSGSDD